MIDIIGTPMISAMKQNENSTNIVITDNKPGHIIIDNYEVTLSLRSSKDFVWGIFTQAKNAPIFEQNRLSFRVVSNYTIPRVSELQS